MSDRYKSLVAVHLIPRRGSEVLLSLRKNTGWMDGFYSLVAGHLEEGEALDEAMIRETQEEAAVTITADQLKFVYVDQRLKESTTDEDYVDLFFECHEWSGEFQNNEPEKCGGLEWFDISALPENTIEYVRKAVSTYERGNNFSVLRVKA